MNLGQAIKLCRSQRKLTQAQLAERAGITPSYLSLLERGERQDPGLSTVASIAEALNVPLSMLVFLAAEDDELKGLDQELAEKLSHNVLGLMRDSA